MSFEWWNNYEQTETQRNKVDLSEVSTSEVEKESGIVKQIKQIEIEDRENDLEELDLLEQQLEYWVDKEIQIKEVKLSLYDKLWINIETENNSDLTKFVKWVVDWLVINNLEEVQALIDSSIEELLGILENLFNVDILKELIKQSIEELWDILNIMENPYNWWIALWTLWLWWLGKLLKWLKIKKDISTSESINKDKIDLLEMKWKYKLDEINDLSPKEASKKIEEFTDSIDIKYLANNPQRINDMLEIVEWICDYINRDIWKILKLWEKDFWELKLNYNKLRKIILKTFTDDSINDKYKLIIKWLKTNKLDRIYNKLNN